MRSTKFETISNDKKTNFKTMREIVNFDGFVKSPQIVMPDLIRHPERIDITGFRLSPE
jgi:hypothetical protein